MGRESGDDSAARLSKKVRLSSGERPIVQRPAIFGAVDPAICNSVLSTVIAPCKPA